MQGKVLVGGELAEPEGKLSKAQKKNMKRMEKKAAARASTDASVASSEVGSFCPATIALFNFRSAGFLPSCFSGAFCCAPGTAVALTRCPKLRSTASQENPFTQGKISIDWEKS